MFQIYGTLTFRLKLKTCGWYGLNSPPDKTTRDVELCLSRKSQVLSQKEIVKTYSKKIFKVRYFTLGQPIVRPDTQFEKEMVARRNNTDQFKKEMVADRNNTY